MAQVGVLSADLTANTADFDAKLNGARRTLSSTQASMNRSLASLEKGFAGVTRVVGALGVGLSTVGFAAFVRRALDVAGGLGEMAQQLGISTDALQTLQFAAAQSGVTIQELQSGIQRFTQTIGDARQGNDEAVRAVRALGREFEQLVASGASIDRLLLAFADAVGGIEDQTVAAARGVDLMGRGFQRLLPIFSGGSSGIQGFAEELDRVGTRLTPEMIAAADRASDAIAAMQFQAGQFANVLAANLAPAITTVLEKLNQLFRAPDENRIKAAIDDVEARLVTFREQLSKGGPKGILGPQIAQAERDLANLKRQLEEVQKAAAKPATTPGAPASPAGPTGGGSLQSQAEQRRQIEAQKIVRDLELQRDSIGKTNAEILRLRLEREQEIVVTERGIEVTRRYTDAQVSAAVAIQEQIDARKRATETSLAMAEADAMAARDTFEAQEALNDQMKVRAEIANDAADLNEQIEAAKKATVEWDNLSQAYRVNTRELDVLIEKQRLVKEGLSADEAQAAAERTIDQAEQLRQATARQTAEVERSNEAARDFAHVIGSSFEDAMLRGAKATDLARSALQDFLRILLRVLVTKPLENTLTGALGGLGGAGGFLGGLGSLFGGNSSISAQTGLFYGGGPSSLDSHILGFATGTDAAPPGMAWVGERGRELVNFGGGEQVFRGDEIAALGSSGPVIYADLRGASAEAVQRLERFVQQINGSIESRSVAANMDAMRRGGRYSQVMRR